MPWESETILQHVRKNPHRFPALATLMALQMSQSDPAIRGHVKKIKDEHYFREIITPWITGIGAGWLIHRITPGKNETRREAFKTAAVGAAALAAGMTVDGESTKRFLDRFRNQLDVIRKSKDFARLPEETRKALMPTEAALELNTWEEPGVLKYHAHAAVLFRSIVLSALLTSLVAGSTWDEKTHTMNRRNFIARMTAGTGFFTHIGIRNYFNHEHLEKHFSTAGQELRLLHEDMQKAGNKSGR